MAKFIWDAMIHLKRVYEAPCAEDGRRVLVERLWPRGLTKQAAAIDLWLKEVSPSPELRKWFGHEPAKWDEFCKRYRAELDTNPDGVARLRQVCTAGTVTFVYAAKDEQHNSAVVLKSYVERTGS
jgi:uncharacterized protein YeaO (DUF488 family)